MIKTKSRLNLVSQSIVCAILFATIGLPYLSVAGDPAVCLWKEGVCDTYACADPVQGTPDLQTGLPSSECRLKPNGVTMGDQAQCKNDKKTMIFGNGGGCGSIWYYRADTDSCIDKSGECGGNRGQYCSPND